MKLIKITGFVCFMALVLYLAWGMFFSVAPAWAHDDAEWINHGRYHSLADGSHCCGPNDCFVVPAEHMSALPSGWNINTTGELVPYRETQSSEDGQFWRCKRHDGSRRCFFAPQPST